MSKFLDQYTFPVKNRAKQIFLLFEGVCPTCGEDNRVVTVGGTSQFHRDFSFNEGLKETWQPECLPFGMRHPVPSNDGCVEFICPAGHKLSIEHGQGDWH